MIPRLILGFTTAEGAEGSALKSAGGQRLYRLLFKVPHRDRLGATGLTPPEGQAWM